MVPVYKNIRMVLLAAGLWCFTACSPELLTGKYTSKLHDEYLVLKENGRSRSYIKAMGVLRINTGKDRYLLSGDSIYFVYKKKGQLYAYPHYAVLDAAGRSFTLYDPAAIDDKKHFVVIESKISSHK